MTDTNGIDIKKLITVPAIITAMVTIVRLLAEFGNLPSWLASKEPGGGGAVIGITWLAPIFAVYFATRLIGASGTFWKNLAKTLFYYGLAARIPVIIIMGLAIFGEWGTHYDAFPPEFPAMSASMKFLLGGVVFQLVLWVGVWTVGIGTLVGVIASKILGEKSETARA
ncbi:MAG: hypothetical protein BMS9Abin37_1549 [Acidobacteriota bacterium]|nr:MAG: hypothetical protein BMS9Abin37_1549 [Acidobacteriota bacterium]